MSYIEQLEQKASEGDPLAQCELGIQYIGMFTAYPAQTKYENLRKYASCANHSKYNKMALYWLRKAANQGYAKAQYTLGGMYLAGDRVARDKKIAVKWFKKAAEQEYADAQRSIDMIYQAEVSKTTIAEIERKYSERATRDFLSSLRVREGK